MDGQPQRVAELARPGPLFIGEGRACVASLRWAAAAERWRQRWEGPTPSPPPLVPRPRAIAVTPPVTGTTGARTEEITHQGRDGRDRTTPKGWNSQRRVDPMTAKWFGSSGEAKVWRGGA